MNDVDSALAALVATVEANLRDKVRAEVRAELMREMRSETILLGKRLIDRKIVAKKLGWSERQLDRMRRSDAKFPKPRNLLSNTPQWVEAEIDRYMDS